MPTTCIFCDEPTGLRAIGAMVMTGNVERPDGEVLCRRCAALPAAEQKRLRDVAMARMLDTSDDPARRHN
jgi:hypothetical protein